MIVYFEGEPFDDRSPILRVISATSGVYVIGDGLLIPVSTEAEGRDFIARVLELEAAQLASRGTYG